jgi:tRNA(Ile)-lysidine synthase
MISTFARSVHEFLRRECRVPESAPIVVAVSGGADSTALLAALTEIRGMHPRRIVAAHLDHALRGESADDAAFVRALALRLGVELREARLDWDDEARRPRKNVEAAGRHERYRFLKRIAEDVAQVEGDPFIAVGHTADDVLESFLIALLRGAGPRGLSHPRARRADRVVRPLLGRTRREIMAYLDERGLAHIEDPTNRDGSNLRSRLRRDVTPLLERENPEVARSAARAARLMAGLDESWTAHTRVLLAALVRSSRPGEIVLDAARGRSYDRHVLTSILRETVARVAVAPPEVGCEPLERIADAWRDGVHITVELTGGVRVRCGAELVSIGAANSAARDAHDLDERRLPVPGRIVWAPFGDRRPDLVTEIVGSVGAVPAVPSAASGPQVAWLDAQRIAFPLRVRGRSPGDRYRPVGLEGTAKVQDLLTDRKIPPESRDALPLVTDGRGILWIPGFRVDERARISDRTTRAVRVEARRISLGTE